MYYRGAQAAFVVYDIRCWISFQMAKASVEKLRHEVSISSILIDDSTEINNNALSLNQFLDYFQF